MGILVEILCYFMSSKFVNERRQLLGLHQVVFTCPKLTRQCNELGDRLQRDNLLDLINDRESH